MANDYAGILHPSDGFGGATLGFGVGLVQDLPRNAILDTLELVLDPLGSTCEFFDSLDPDNPDNFVLKTAKAWQEGDSFSRGRMVGNITGQMAIAFTPAIAKKFAKLSSAKLSRSHIPEIKPEAVSITGEVKQGSYLKPNLQLFAEEAEPIIFKNIHGEERNIRVHIGKQNKHIPKQNNYENAVRQGKTPSIFYGTTEDAQRLVDEFAGKGIFADELGTTERVNFKKVIGIYVDESTGNSLETTWGTIKIFKRWCAYSSIQTRLLLNT